MKSRLITPTLLNSIDFLKSCPESWKERAYDGLKAMLGRAPFKPTDAIMKGIKFEDKVYSVLSSGKPFTGSDEFKQVLNACKGGVFQGKVKKAVEIDGQEYCLYGKKDVTLPGKIIDIKTTGKYKGPSKYLNTYQHKIYCLVDEVKTFEYVVAVWKYPDAPMTDKRSRVIDFVKIIPYEVEDFKLLEADVRQKIKDSVEYLSAFDDLFQLFTDTYSRG